MDVSLSSIGLDSPAFLVCMSLCVIFELVIGFRSMAHANQGYVDNGPQMAVTIGVLFTFIGIAQGLLFFNADGEALRTSITQFLTGMKTAFFTSIFGMLVSFFIRYQQGSIIEREDRLQSEQMEKSLDTSVALGQIDWQNLSTSGPLRPIFQELRQLRATVEAQSSAALAMKLDELSRSIQMYSAQNEKSLAATQELMEHMDAQTKAFSLLGEDIKAASVETTQKQSAYLAHMDENIAQMAKDTKESYENSQHLLAQAGAFQQTSLGHQERQLAILQDNTQQIVEMKTAFQQFLDDMAKKNNEEFIKALNESMKRLNEQLTEQFGENFQHLNEAVYKLNDWQEHYLETVEKTTGELQATQQAFDTYVSQYVPQVKLLLTHVTGDLLPQVHADLDTVGQQITAFDASTQQNVQTLREMQDVSKKLDDTIRAAQASVLATGEHAQNVHRDTEALLTKLGEAVTEEGAQLSRHLATVSQEMADGVGQMRDDMTNTLAQMEGELSTGWETMSHGMQDQLARMSGEMLQRTEAFGEQQQAAFQAQLAAMTQKLADAAQAQVQSLDAASRNTIEGFQQISAAAVGAQTDIADALTKLQSMTQQTTTGIGQTLEGFNMDLRDEISKSMTELNATLETIAKDTGLQGRKSVEQLAGVLSKVTERMTENYTKLVERIRDVDQLLRENGGR